MQHNKPDAKTEFRATIDWARDKFTQNKLIQAAHNGNLDISHYQRLLCMIFNQTFYGPTYLALAGANCGPRQVIARDYLLKHAEEEKTHWTWVLNDLKNTQFAGQDPRSAPIPEPCQAYMAYNFMSLTKCRFAGLV